MAVKAVVFDYGKVISFPPHPDVRKTLAGLAGIAVEQFDELDRLYRHEYDRGDFDGKGYYKTILAREGVFPPDEILEKIAAADMESWKRINPATEKLMEDIRALGFKVGILSNMPSDFLEWARANIPLFTRYDAGIFSCEADCAKPDPVIYEKMRKALACEFQEIVFFDDLPQNVEGAGAMGMTAFIFTDPVSARKDLRNSGLAEL